jgi:hypothetical protein
MQEIRRLVVEGFSYQEIQQQLGLSERTFFRYLSAVFAHDRQVMNQRVTDEEVLNQIVILRDPLNKMFRELEEMANDSSVDGMARVKARHLVGEIAVSVVKILREVPARLAANKELPYTRNELPRAEDDEEFEEEHYEDEKQQHDY